MLKVALIAAAGALAVTRIRRNAATQVISGPAMPLAVWRQQTEEEECNDTHDVFEPGGRLDLRRGRRRADR